MPRSNGKIQNSICAVQIDIKIFSRICVHVLDIVSLQAIPVIEKPKNPILDKRHDSPRLEKIEWRPRFHCKLWSLLVLSTLETRKE